MFIDIFQPIKFSQSLKEIGYLEVGRDLQEVAEDVTVSLSVSHNLHMSHYWYRLGGGLTLFFTYLPQGKTMIVEVFGDKTIKTFIHDDCSNEILFSEEIKEMNFTKSIQKLKEER